VGVTTMKLYSFASENDLLPLNAPSFG
jgi:hypothetical protein